MGIDKNTKWMACIRQEYDAEALAPTLSYPNGARGVKNTQVAEFILFAESAQDAMDKAEKGLKVSGIERAYVDGVCLFESPLVYDITKD